MEAVTVERLDALDRLKRVDRKEFYKHIQAILDLICVATPRDIEIFEAVLSHYHGEYLEVLTNVAATRKGQDSFKKYVKPALKPAAKQSDQTAPGFFSQLWRHMRVWASQQREEQQPLLSESMDAVELSPKQQKRQQNWRDFAKTSKPN